MPGRFTCASAYYPITYGQAPTLIMKTLKDGRKQLVASGYVCKKDAVLCVSLFSCWLLVFVLIVLIVLFALLYFGVVKQWLLLFIYIVKDENLIKKGYKGSLNLLSRCLTIFIVIGGIIYNNNNNHNTTTIGMKMFPFLSFLFFVDCYPMQSPSI